VARPSHADVLDGPPAEAPDARGQVLTRRGNNQGPGRLPRPGPQLPGQTRLGTLRLWDGLLPRGRVPGPPQLLAQVSERPLQRVHRPLPRRVVHRLTPRPPAEP